MFNVLNQDGEKISVEVIDPTIHRHLSGREFSKDDACVIAAEAIKPKRKTRKKS